MFYPEEIVEEVRIRNDIVNVISSYIRLQKRGSSHMGLCPFHNEKSPSFSVSESKQMYHCFGCGVSGNVFTFIMEYENYNFVEALKYLAERGGIKLPEAEYSKEAKANADLRGKLLEVQKQAAKYFYMKLKSDRGDFAYRYLLDRQLKEETIIKFGLGYSDKYSDDLYRYLKTQGYEDELLRQSGLIRIDEVKGAHDKFWNRVMFPIMDVNNKVIGFGGRVMGDGMPKYLNSPETKIFDKSRNLYGLNFARVSRKRQILLCEGYMDVIAIHQGGFTNAVASLGTAFTGLQANLLKRYADEVIITYDSDEAGVKAALRAIPILKEAGLTVKVLNMKPYKDPDEFLKALGVEEFRKQIEEAQNSFFFEIEILEKGYDFMDPEQKTRFFNEMAKRLLVFTEELERNNYMEALARKYKIRFEDLRGLVNQYGAKMTVIPGYEPLREKKYPSKHKKEDGMKQAQKILLTWLIEDNRLFQKVDGIITPDDFKEELYHKVASILFAQYEESQSVTPAKIINYFENKEEQNEAASLFHTTLSEEMSLIEKEKAFNEIVLRIKKYSLDYASRYVTDMVEMQNIIKQQMQLQKLHISLKDSEL